MEKSKLMPDSWEAMEKMTDPTFSSFVGRWVDWKSLSSVTLGLIRSQLMGIEDGHRPFPSYEQC